MVAAVSIATCLAVYLVVEAEAGNAGVWLSLGIAVVVAAGIAWWTRRGHATLTAVGRYDEPVADQVLGGVARRPAGGD